MSISDIIEKLADIKNIAELLEISLRANADDPHIIRSVNIINRQLASVLEEAAEGLDKQPGGD